MEETEGDVVMWEWRGGVIRFKVFRHSNIDGASLGWMECHRFVKSLRSTRTHASLRRLEKKEGARGKRTHPRPRNSTQSVEEFDHLPLLGII